MSIQRTPEQERRVHAVVKAGAFPSAAEALDAAAAAMESVAIPAFEGAPEELDELLAEGLRSGEPAEADQAFWSRLRARTDRMVAEYREQKPRS